jgi:hypothetical protein
MPWIVIADITGPRGSMGAQGLRGLPGVNALANVDAVAAYIADIGTNALRTAFEDKVETLLVGVNNHPRLRKPLTAPIITQAQSSLISMYTPNMVNNADGGGSGWSLFNSTDHAPVHSDSGVSRATAPTPFGPFTDLGRVYRDDVAGIQTETPYVFWDEPSAYWIMMYQQGGDTGTGQQSTMWARSRNLNTWTRMGFAAQYTPGDAGDGHTGYFKGHWIGGTHYGFSLYGGNDWGRSAVWTRDDGPVDSCTWTPDHRQITGQAHLLGRFGNGIEGSPKTDPRDPDIGSVSRNQVSMFGGTVVNYRGRPWWIGKVASVQSGGGNPASTGAIVTAPLRDDLLGLAEKPIDITPPLQDWENGAQGGLSSAFEYNSKTYVAYRGGGTSTAGGVGIMEVY